MRCDVCGKFRPANDLLECEESFYEGHSERWVECRFCLPPATVKTYWTEPTNG